MKDYATGIQHVGIPTKDMDATKKFYEDLGFEAAFETVNDEARVCFLKMYNLVMEVYESEDAAGKSVPLSMLRSMSQILSRFIRKSAIKI